MSSLESRINTMMLVGSLGGLLTACMTPLRTETGSVDTGDTNTEQEGICVEKWVQYGGIEYADSEPLIADLDGDGTQEIIMKRGHIGYDCLDVCDYVDPSTVYVFDYNGNLVLGWPSSYGKIVDPNSDYSVGKRNTFAVGDLDRDGTKEVVYADGDSLSSWVLAYHHNGTLVEGWPVYIDELFSKSQSESNNFKISLGNVQGDKKLEVIGITRDSIYVWTNNGELANGWPQSHEAHNVTVALGDLDNDGESEIINTGYSNILAWHGDGSYVDGYPVDVENSNFASNAHLADLDGDGILDIVRRGLNYLYEDGYEYWIDIISSDGKIENTFSVPGNTYSIIGGVVGVLSEGENSSIIQASYYRETVDTEEEDYDVYLHAYDPTGYEFQGWPAELEPINYEQNYGIYMRDYQIIADINGDESREVLVITNGSPSTRVYSSEGTLQNIIYIDFGNLSEREIAVGDLDGNGRIDIVHTETLNMGCLMHVFECEGEYNPTNISWAMDGHDPQRTYNHETLLE